MYYKQLSPFSFVATKMITLSVLVVIVLLNDIRAGKTDLHYIWSHLPTKNVS